MNPNSNEARSSASSGPEPANSGQTVMVFVQDRDSEGVIRQSLGDLNVGNVIFGNAGVSGAVSELANKPSPRLLIVDIGRVADPLAQIKELANVCEPSTGVIVIGESNDIRLYRDLKSAGVVEYFFKPLVRNLFTQTCSMILTGEENKSTTRTGKLVLTLSVRGGAGATTIATRSAWHLATERDRRVLLVDLDLYMGDAALQLGALPTNGLREMLEHPDRIDNLLLERALIHATPRLDILASLLPLDQLVQFREDAILSLLENLLHRYRYVFVDMPGTLATQMMQVMHLPSICLLVSDARLPSARDVARWRARVGPNTPERTTLHILNKFGAHGSLHLDQFAKAAGQAPDVVVPYGREIEAASTLGTDGVAKCSAMTHALAPVFRDISGEAAEESRSFLGRLLG